MLPKLYGYGSTSHAGAEATPLTAGGGMQGGAAASYQAMPGMPGSKGDGSADGADEDAHISAGGGSSIPSSGRRSLHDLSVPRDKLVAVLAGRRDRAVHCRSLPMSLLLYAVFTGAVLTHIQVGPSYDMEAG
jgi:hypothetical protein